ncbi:MAG: hypothetical protein H7A48_09630 [Akkermansiaceae bacterium]|nr:hypothetical protein [Akkermansiaceae bacterium]
MPPRGFSGYESTVPEPDTDLWRNIRSFELDDPEAGLPFTSRLAREQSWTHAEAARAITEYKRFLYLAMIAGHPVTPSEAVDQVWHLHLLYTRSYWQGLCGEALGRELHHEPTKGGGGETGKFTDWYERTLESYRQHFGESPPSDLWPAAKVRMARKPAARWVEPGRFWIVPKLRLFRRSPFS